MAADAPRSKMYADIVKQEAKGCFKKNSEFSIPCMTGYQKYREPVI